VFGSKPAAVEPAVDIIVPRAKIGGLTLANDFWPMRREGYSFVEHKAIIDRAQAWQFGISHSSVYYLLRAVSSA